MVGWQTRGLILLPTLLAISLARGATAEQAGPNAPQPVWDFRDRLVRIEAKSAPGATFAARGFGFVVGEGLDNNDHPVAFVVTADHVVRDEENNASPYGVFEVQFQVDPLHRKQGHLLDVRLPPEQGDLAVLEVPKPSDYAPKIANVAPIPQDTGAWRLGKQPDVWNPWQPGHYVGPYFGVWLNFEDLDTPEGTSGAPVVSAQGLVGMVVAESADRISRVLAAEVIDRVARYWGLKWDMKPAPMCQTPPAAPDIDQGNSLLLLEEKLSVLLKTSDHSPLGVPGTSTPNATAQFRKGYNLDPNETAHGNGREAAYWYALAAKQGNAKALTQLGQLVVHGQHGGAADPAGAALLWWFASLMGSAVASCNLGIMYRDGEGVVTANPELAARWFEIAAGRHYVCGAGQ